MNTTRGEDDESVVYKIFYEFRVVYSEGEITLLERVGEELELRECQRFRSSKIYLI